MWTAGSRYETTRVSVRVYAGRVLSVWVASCISLGRYIGAAIIQMPIYTKALFRKIIFIDTLRPIFDAQGIVPLSNVDITWIGLYYAEINNRGQIAHDLFNTIIRN